MKSDRLSREKPARTDDAGDARLDDAFRAVRDRYDGTNEQSNTTLHRALFRTRTRERRQRFARWIVLPAAAVLVASTAWAGVTGRLAPAMRSVMDVLHDERPAPVSVSPPVSAPPVPSSVAEATPAPTPEPVGTTTLPIDVPPVSPPPIARAPEPVVTAPAAPVASAPVASAPVTAPLTAAPTASAADPHAALFAEAHRLHFTERDSARALDAWDRYLAAAPDGRFAPEARYNRALTLVRLGRRAEAQTELAAFANGMYGDYRRAEAKALLEGLTRDASRP